GWREAQSDRFGRRLAEVRLRGLRGRLPLGERPRGLRRVGRVGRADPPGCAPRRLRGRQRQAAGCPACRGTRRAPGRLRGQPAGARGPVGRRRVRATVVSRRGWFGALLAATLAAALTFLALPLVAILVDTSPAALLDSLGDGQSLDALRLSVETSALALAAIVLVGTPAAYLLATRSFRGRALVVTILELPLVLPPAVAGIALLAALGPKGILGPALADAGVELVLTTAGVVVALTFVASPFYLRQAQAAFAAVDPTLLAAARTLGAGEARAFVRVAIPLARDGLAAGAA